MEPIGWVGGILLAFCGLPQAWAAYKTKSADGITWGFLGMWGFGEILTLLYILPKLDWPLLFNYGANLVFLAVIAYYKIRAIK